MDEAMVQVKKEFEKLATMDPGSVPWQVSEHSDMEEDAIVGSGVLDVVRANRTKEIKKEFLKQWGKKISREKNAAMVRETLKTMKTSMTSHTSRHDEDDAPQTPQAKRDIIDLNNLDDETAKTLMMQTFKVPEASEVPEANKVPEAHEASGVLEAHCVVH